MSDFDAVLERLVTDPSFAASLAADRVAALAGYDLDAAELDLLSAQVGGDAGGETVVEARESKASMFGLLTPLIGATGIGGVTAQAGFGEATTQAGFGEVAARSGFGPAGVGAPEASGFGAAAQLGAGAVTDAGFGAADVAAAEGFGTSQIGTPIGAGFGATPFGDQPTDGSLIGAELSGLIGRDMQGFGVGAPPAESDLPTGPQPTDYDTRVDVNGDGRWDQHMYRERADGGIDIVADMDHDGRADFVGTDYDRDGLVDAANYDRNHDGRFETHMFDDDRDGWLDRTITSPEG